MGFPPRFPGWFYAVLLLCPMGGAVLAGSCGVETRGQAADTRKLIEEPHENLPLAVLLCGPAGLAGGAPGLGLGLGRGSSCAVAGSAPTMDGPVMPLWDDNGVDDRLAGVDLELDESLLQVDAPLRAGEGEAGAARPAKTAVWRRRTAHLPVQVDVAGSAPPAVDGTKWAVWGGLIPASVSRDDLRGRASRAATFESTGDVPEVDGSPRGGAMQDYADKRRAMERNGGFPPMVVDAVASGGLPIYRPIGGQDGAGIVLKPSWRGVALSLQINVE